jgi:rRNA maturation RNase YbeY
MPSQNKKPQADPQDDIRPEIFFHSEETPFVLRSKRLIREWVLKVIAKEGKVAGQINIIFTNDNYLYELNIKYLQHNTLTDIITFDYSVDNQISGDVFISIERVRDNAKNLNQSILNETHRVIIHGILHLIGYKDKTAQQKKIMRAKEDNCLSLLAKLNK